MKTKSIHAIVLLFLIYACHNKFDQPPLSKVIAGAELSVQMLKQHLTSNNSLFHFSGGDSTIVLTVLMDESSGNIFKQIYAIDKDGSGILLKLNSSGGIYLGDKIRINLNNVWLVCANSMVSLDSLDLAKNIVKLSSGNLCNPVNATIDEILATTGFNDSRNFQSKLVNISDVEFDFAAQNLTLANAIGKSALEHQIGKCGGTKIGLRTSGLASFASKEVPKGHGNLIAIVQQYNNDFTLVLRNYYELQMQGALCGPLDTASVKTYLYKDFDDKSLSAGGWLNVSVTGTTSWATSNIGQSTYYARIYNKSNNIYEACETWLISPEINLSNSIDPILSFMTANSSTASPLSLMVSSDYLQGAPNSVNWTGLTYAFQKNSFTYFPSGDLSLNAYKNKKIKIAFKYTGTSTSGSIWDVDKVILREK